MKNSVDRSNLETLKEIIGDDLKEILFNFIKTSPEMIEQIKHALNTEDADALRLHAHTLKGSSANIGAVKLPDLSFELERKGIDGVTKGLEDNLLNVETELDNVNLFLQNYISSAF